jgi:iron-sulfur cluster assembly protein
MSEQVTARPARRPLPPLMTLTEGALARLRGLYGSSHQGQLLRITVSTKGCSGMSYEMEFVAEAATGDEIVKSGDLTLLVDRKAAMFLIGTEMDYESAALSAGFTFRNPNEKGRCGCGESFHI